MVCPPATSEAEARWPRFGLVVVATTSRRNNKDQMIRPILGRVSAHYIALLIYTCFCAYTTQARFTANGKIRREIQNPQMFETDPESFPPAIYFNQIQCKVFVEVYEVK
jgi:hypothetical protein